jgi:hypothetical protein
MLPGRDQRTCHFSSLSSSSSIEWIVTASEYTPTAGGGLAGNYAITNDNNCLPYLICAYSSHLEIGSGRIVNLIP